MENPQKVDKNTFYERKYFDIMLFQENKKCFAKNANLRTDKNYCIFVWTFQIISHPETPLHTFYECIHKNYDFNRKHRKITNIYIFACSRLLIAD